MNQQIQHYILIFKIDGVFYWKVFSPQLKPQTQKFYPHNKNSTPTTTKLPAMTYRIFFCDSVNERKHTFNTKASHIQTNGKLKNTFQIIKLLFLRSHLLMKLARKHPQIASGNNKN